MNVMNANELASSKKCAFGELAWPFMVSNVHLKLGEWRKSSGYRRRWMSRRTCAPCFHKRRTLLNRNPKHENESYLLQGSGPNACAHASLSFAKVATAQPSSAANVPIEKGYFSCVKVVNGKADFLPPPIWRTTILDTSYTYHDSDRKVDGWKIFYLDDSIRLMRGGTHRKSSERTINNGAQFGQQGLPIDCRQDPACLFNPAAA
jgi:hypothetical protein